MFWVYNMSPKKCSSKWSNVLRKILDIMDPKHTKIRPEILWLFWNTLVRAFLFSPSGLCTRPVEEVSGQAGLGFISDFIGHHTPSTFRILVLCFCRSCCCNFKISAQFVLPISRLNVWPLLGWFAHYLLSDNVLVVLFDCERRWVSGFFLGCVNKFTLHRGQGWNGYFTLHLGGVRPACTRAGPIPACASAGPTPARACCTMCRCTSLPYLPDK